MKKEIQRVIFLAGVIAMSACSKTSFSQVDPVTNAQFAVPVDPVTPVPVPTPAPPAVVIPDPVYSSKISNGACSADSSTNVLSCLKCEVPLNPPLPPQLSAKAQALVDTMFLACQVPNTSDKNSFRPTKEMLVTKLNRGSQGLYPETSRTSQMAMVIEGLTNTKDDSLRKKMFGGLWYTGSYSDAFETYFGLTVAEAKSTFCWDGNVQTPGLTGVTGLYSKQWADCQSGENPWNCKEIPSYVAAQGYRAQLQKVLEKSITSPYIPPAQVPAKACAWDKFDGDDMVAALKQYKAWKAEGRKLSVEIKNANGVGSCGDASESSFVVGVTVSIASYVCR